MKRISAASPARGSPAEWDSARRLTAKLVHDVAKYVARTARNIGAGPWSPDLVAMLCRDLFALPRGRASAVFEELARLIEDVMGPQAAFARVREQLARIDALEVAVRQGEPAALARAVAAALAVEEGLRAFARRLQEKGP
jgi:hypothetical protein